MFKRNSIRIEFNDLQSHNSIKKYQFYKVFKKIIKSSQFLFGEELAKFENEFQHFLATSGRAIGVANGSDALLIALKVKNLPSNSQVLVAANTYFAAAASVARLGLIPKFIDVVIDSRFPNDEIVNTAISENVSAYIKSHLFGGADTSQLSQENRNVIILNDSSQSHGTKVNNKFIGDENTTTYSFYPAKNLGSFGDAGAILSFNDEEIENILMLRNQGTLEDKYLHQIIGFNSRMSEIQAGILRIKLSNLMVDNIKRKLIFQRYRSNLESVSHICHIFDYPTTIDATHHLVQIRIPGSKAKSIQNYLKVNGIETGRHYPLPLHLQPAFKYLGYARGDFPNAEILAEESISLPVFPTMENWKVDFVSEKIISYCLRES